MHPTLTQRQRAVEQETAQLDRQIASLRERRNQCWNDFLAQAGILWACGQLTFDDLVELADICRSQHGPGYRSVWNEHIPHDPSSVQAKAASVRRAQPNYDGGWRGSIPLAGDMPAPRDGEAVVYLLFDADGLLIYIGSTERLAARLAEHQREKPSVVAWIAVACADRPAAYVFERQLLRRIRTPLNRNFL